MLTSTDGFTVSAPLEDNNGKKRTFDQFINEDNARHGRTTKIVEKSFTQEIMKEMRKLMAKEMEAKEFPKPNIKKVAPRINVRLNNRRTAMRRNFVPGQKEKALLPFTIRRTQMHEVRKTSLPALSL